MDTGLIHSKIPRLPKSALMGAVLVCLKKERHDLEGVRKVSKGFSTGGAASEYLEDNTRYRVVMPYRWD